MHSFINEKDAVFPVPESPVNIVILFENSLKGWFPYKFAASFL